MLHFHAEAEANFFFFAAKSFWKAYLGIEMLIFMVKPIWSPSNQDRLKLFHNFIDWFAEHISGLKAKKGREGLLA